MPGTNCWQANRRILAGGSIGLRREVTVVKTRSGAARPRVGAVCGRMGTALPDVDCNSRAETIARVERRKNAGNVADFLCSAAGSALCTVTRLLASAPIGAHDSRLSRELFSRGKFVVVDRVTSVGRAAGQDYNEPRERLCGTNGCGTRSANRGLRRWFSLEMIE